MREPLDNARVLREQYFALYRQTLDLAVSDDQRPTQAALLATLDRRCQLLVRYEFLGRPLEDHGLTDGIKQILWEAAEPMKVKDLIAALEERGVPCHAKNKDTSVRTTLMRSKDVLRTGTGLYKLADDE